MYNFPIFAHQIIRMSKSPNVTLMFAAGLLWLALMNSCAKQQDFVYFQRQANDSSMPKLAKPIPPVLHPGDIVSITVTAIDPDVVKPFNMGGGISSGNTASPAAGVYGYLINDKGQVEFPVLGSVNLDGLTRIQAVALLREKIKVYVNNPIVDLKIMNHKISVLGEVKLPGVYPITNEQMTLTEAIAMSGDLLISGVRKNVLVIREVNGVKTETRVDLTSSTLFESPVYYLQNNDIIYIQPTKARIASAGQTLQYTSLAIGSLSLIINLLNILTR